MCLCVCLCVSTHQSISVCISTSLYRYSVFSYAGVSIMYASGSLVFKCWRLTVRGDGLHHHLQHYAYYIRWRSAAEGPFPAFQGWGSCTHGASARNSVTRSSRRIKDRAQGKVDRPHTVWDKHTCPRKRELPVTHWKRSTLLHRDKV